MIGHLSHACFTTSDLAATRRFYEDILKFKVVHEFRNDRNETYGLYFGIGNSTFLEFFQGPALVDPGNLFRHICVAVDDLRGLSEELLKAGFKCEISRGRTDRTLQAWISDPNGVKVEFHEYDSDSLLSQFQ